MARHGRFCVLGSGPSTGSPWLQCVISKKNCCPVCAECMKNPSSLNHRNNPSGLVSVSHPDGQDRHVLIDVGKTFRETAMKNFPALGVDRIHAVILTHPHADAIMGLDDLRDVSPKSVLPVYLTADCFRHVASCFPYLVNTGTAASTFIAKIEWRLMTAWEPFAIPEAGGLVVTPVPVEHGAGAAGTCMSFEFGSLDSTRDLSAFNGNRDDLPAGTITLLSKPFSAAHGPVEPSTNDMRRVRAASVGQPPASGAGTAGTAQGGGTGGQDAVMGSLDATSVMRPDLAPSFEPCLPTQASGGASTGTGSPSPSSTAATDRVLYISDVCALDAHVRAYFRARPTSLLILDALNYMRYSTHYSMCQAVNCAADLAPAVCRLVGMNHRIDHDLEHTKLQAWGRGGDHRLRGLRHDRGAACADTGGGAAASPVGAGSGQATTGIDLGLAHDGWHMPITFSVAPYSLDRVKAEVAAVRDCVTSALARYAADEAAGLTPQATPISSAGTPAVQAGATGCGGMPVTPIGGGDLGDAVQPSGSAAVLGGSGAPGSAPGGHGRTACYGPAPRYDYVLPAWPEWQDDASPTVQHIIKGWRFT